MSPFASLGRLKLVLRLELSLFDLPGIDGDLPVLENDVLLDGGKLESGAVADAGDCVEIGEFGPLYLPLKSSEGMSGLRPDVSMMKT
jgi:hypothetical protein